MDSKDRFWLSMDDELPDERRDSQRRDSGAFVEVSWTGPAGYESVHARVSDRSNGGCCVESQFPVPERLQVLVAKSSDESLWGEVRYCSHSVSGYRSGIEFKTEPTGVFD